MPDRPEQETPAQFDVVVVGAGAAGLWTAIRAADAGATVCLVSRKPLDESASFWAQGGLAAALGSDDSTALHADDTETAGRGLCRQSAVDLLTSEAPRMVSELLSRGMQFDLDADGNLALALEGGHSARRIIHAGGSSTGQLLTRSLTRMAADHPGVTVMEETSALTLWSDGSRCFGVLTDRGALSGGATVLATGGAAALWMRSSNPWGAIGAGPVLASQAGADLADLEFCQFHPTCLFAPGSQFDGALITEAVRGEGAVLLDADGKRFTDELAPRDEVSAAVFEQAGAQGGKPVTIDLRQIEPERFPSVFSMLSDAGFQPDREPVPVSPGSHYVMGGIAVDLDGRSTLPGLYAAGECSCTGVHGANRLASNSLTECFVFGERAALAAVDESPSESPPAPDSVKWRFTPPTEETRARVWELAGPVRDEAGLRQLTDDPYPLAAAIGKTALARRETRGGHRRSDHPERDPGLDQTHLVVKPDGSTATELWR